MEAKDKQLKMSRTSKISSANDAVQTSNSSVREKKIVQIVDTTSSKNVGIASGGKPTKSIDPLPQSDLAKNDKSDLKSSKRDDSTKVVVGSTPPSKKIKSYDYAAWDKFDVDKALVNFAFTS